jgi:hypothetical protein
MLRKTIFILVATWLVTGCVPYPDDAERIEDFDSVITLFDWSTSLAGYETYILSDEVIPITPDTNNIGIPYEIFEPDGPVTDFVLSKVRENMDVRGFVEVDDPDEADLLINAGYVVLTTTVTQVYWCGDPWYWFWDPYWYGPGYGWGYPTYSYYYTYPCNFSYSYDVGTMLIQMIDGIGIDHNSLKEIWVGVFRGFATGTTDLTRIAFGVDQAFDQTPFFNAQIPGS